MKTFINQILAFSIVLGSVFTANAQCSLTTLATDQTITCGDCVTLSAFGSGSGAVAFQENFNSGAPVGWGFTQAVTIANNTCGVPSPDGTPFMWMGDASVNPRDMSTVNLNVAIGGTICFEMRYSEQGDASPCEGPDEPGEGVYLQYSINNGATWIQIQYYQPDPVNNSPTVAWNEYCAVIPAGAMTSATRFRWHQDAVSGAEYDHWGIDNVSITLADPTYQISWTGGAPAFSYPIGNGGGNNPTPVCPLVTTAYSATITNGTTTCNSSVTVTVVNPTIVITAPNDTSICPGTCIPLPTQAYELVSPASTPTFSNFEPNVSIVTPQIPFALPCTSFGGCACPTGGSVGFGATCPPTPGSISASADLAVAGLNGNNLGNSAPTNGTSQITGLCIPSVSILGACPGLSLADVAIILEHPNGTQVVLAAVGSLSGSTIVNMCFQLGAPAVSTGSGTYTSTFAPQNSWTSLNGLVSEGTWKLKLSGINTELCISTVNLTGWNISFNDPLLTSPVNFTWAPNSPSTLITGGTTLNPTVCPPLGATTFTLTATDLAGCTSVSEPVTVTSAACCPLVISDTNLIQTTCGLSNGSITVLTTGSVAGLEFSINGGTTWIPATGTTGVFTGLAAGTYSLQARNGAGCVRTITNVVLNASTFPSITSTTPVMTTCGLANGEINITASGVGPLTFSSTEPAVFAPGTTATSNSFTGLATATYPIRVRDGNNCVALLNVFIFPSSLPTFLATPTQPVCGGLGSIQVTATGNGPFTFSINGGAFAAGATATTANYLNRPAASYTIQVRDANGCSSTIGTTNLTPVGAPTFTTTSTTPSCIVIGSITVTPLGTAPFTYSIDGDPYVAGNGINEHIFSPVTSGNHGILVQDAVGCVSALTVVNVPSGPGVSISGAAMVVTDVGCTPNSGAISGLTVTGSNGPYTYLWNTGATTLDISNLAAGTYGVTFADADGCSAGSVTGIVVGSIGSIAPTITSTTPTQPTCGTANGAIDVVASGAATLQFSINGAAYVNGTTATTITFGTLNSGNYNILVRDGNGCISTVTTEILTAPGAPTLTTVATQPTCGNIDGNIAVTASGNGPFTFNLNGGAFIPGVADFTNLAASATAYVIVVTDASGCTATSSESLPILTPPTFTAVPTQPVCAGTGSILVTPTGTGPFTYSSDNGGTFVAGSTLTTHTFASLAPTTFDILVEDANGCVAAASLPIAIIATTLPTITSTTPTQATCGSSNGTIAVVATGAGPLQFSRVTPAVFAAGTTATTNNFTGLAAGSYTIQVRDANGCIVSSALTTITSAGGPTFTAVATQPTCGGTGSILVTPTGTGPFTYSKVNPAVFTAGTTATTNTFGLLASGTYPISIKDANGCTSAITNVLINASSSPVISNPTVTNATCGAANGAINAITVTGGVGPHTFSINGGTTTQSANTFTGLLGAVAPGQSYTISVTDALGCVATNVNVTILSSVNSVVDAGVDQIICSGNQATLTGSGAPTLSWSPSITNNVSFTPVATTTYTLTGTDALGCTDTDQVTVTLVVAPPPTAIFSNNTGCSPLSVLITSAGANSTWDFGDGSPVAFGNSQTHTYPDAGDYSVTLTESTTIGAISCVSTGVFADTIHVYGHPIASFATTPKELIQTEPLTNVINTSSGAVAYQWNFGDQTFSSLPQPTHLYSGTDSMSYTIQLVAVNEAGCTDTAYNTVVIIEDLIFYLPNTFTPDGNAFNQTFQPVFTSGFDPFNYRMAIYDRWGELIYETKDDKVGWDGSYSNSNLVQEGVYVWKIEFKTNRNDARKMVVGHVNVLR